MREYDFNDDLSTILDQSLSASGLHEEYRKNRNRGWILKVEGESLRNGLQHMTKRQIAIIEGLFFDGLCLEDICQNHGMSYEEVQKEIKNMYIRLTRG